MAALTCPETSRRAGLPFAAALLLSSGLLFFIQPLASRLITPLIGGSSGVWLTAMLFFQITLIAGYFYADRLRRLGRLRIEIALHLALCLSCFIALPVATPANWEMDETASAALQSIWLHATVAGLPFFFLSANSSLFQSWFTRLHAATNPYPLYRASNIGSLAALLAFPLLAEPFLNIPLIAALWTGGFAMIAGFLCLALWYVRGQAQSGSSAQPQEAHQSAAPGARADYLFWALAGFTPSALSLAITTRISADYGALPIVWTVPLALFLLSFIPTFSDKRSSADDPFLLGGLGFFCVMAGCGLNAWMPLKLISLSLSLTGLWLVCVVAHRQLYLRRPPPQHLTSFYLTMSIGGAGGGVLNALIAPQWLTGMQELHIALLSFLLLLSRSKLLAGIDWRAGAALISGCGLVVLAGSSFSARIDNDALHAVLVLSVLTTALFMALPSSRPMALAFAAAIAVLPGWMPVGDDQNVLLQDRSFFGTHRIAETDKGMRLYMNGNTLHGAQKMDAKLPPEPQIYYARSGPLGNIATSQIWTGADRVAIIGLGTGAMSSYLQPHQKLDFFEIDQLVADIASNPEWFTYLSAQGDRISTVIGDARVTLGQSPHHYGLIIIDAYSSDAIPVHLATLEAIEGYRSKLAPGGALLFHISNRHFSMEPVLGAAAEMLGMTALQAKYKTDDDLWVNSVIFLSDPSVKIGEQWKPFTQRLSTPWTDARASALTALKYFH